MATDTLKPPAKRLPAEPVCETVEDLERAACELSYLKALEAHVKAECDQAIQAAKDTASKQLVTRVGSGKVPVADRAAALEEAIGDYAEAHKSELLGEGDGKTVSLNHVELAWRYKPESVTHRESSWVTVKKIVEALDLLKRFAEWLQQIVIRKATKSAKATTAQDLIKLEAKPDLKAATAAYKEGRLKKTDLRKYGLQVVGGDDVLQIKPRSYDLNAAA